MANMVQADKFDGGDIDDYLEHFDICALANGWEQERKALMIATCFKGEALEVFKTLDGKCLKGFANITSLCEGRNVKWERGALHIWDTLSQNRECQPISLNWKR